MRTMIFITEWALAVHKAFWFPLLWMSGLEAHPLDTGWLPDGEKEEKLEETWTAGRAA